MIKTVAINEMTRPVKNSANITMVPTRGDV
jgi:hypothetical protein